MTAHLNRGNNAVLRTLPTAILTAWIAVQWGCNTNTTLKTEAAGDGGTTNSDPQGTPNPEGKTERDGGIPAETEPETESPSPGTDDEGCARPPDTRLEIDTDTADDRFFDVRYDLSPEIPTVGVVTWTISQAIRSASIVFGPADVAFEQRGAVDLDSPEHRALLLGMKPDSTYKFVLIAEGDRIYTSAPYEIATGPQRTGLPNPSIRDEPGCGVPFGGFTIGCIDSGIGSEESTSTVYIFDRDGDHVWWYEFPVDGCARARMSFDGKRMWGGNANVTGNEGALFSVTMDGRDERLYTSDEVPGMEKRHHDFAVLENGNILYFERDPLPPGKGATPFGTYINDEADTIYELNPETLSKTRIFYQMDHFADAIREEGSHTNAISFVPHLHAVAFSMKNIHTIAVVGYPDGALLATYGGVDSDFGVMAWDTQHDFQVSPDGLVLFNNNGPTNGSASLKFTIENGTASLDWEYSPGIQSNAWGSAVQLPNGNFLVVFSNNGLIHELSPAGELLQSTSISDIAYVERRASLYGPPPPWDR